METRKKRKQEANNKPTVSRPNFDKIYNSVLEACHQSEDHPYVPLLSLLRKLNKRPILQTLQPQNEIFKINPQRKKRPIQIYLDSVTHLYKKRDLDILLNPVTLVSPYQRWAPREIAIFEEGLVRFGKQFQFISEMIVTKSTREVYQFYLQWKTTSHYRSYRSHSCPSRTNIQDYI